MPDASRMLPLVPGARFVVECQGCGFRADSAELDESKAVGAIARRHRCARPALHARSMDYAEHPLHKGRL